MLINFHMKIVFPCSRNKNEKQRFATRRGSPLTAKTCRKDGDLSTVWSSLTFSSFPTGTMSTPYGCSWRSSRRVSGLLLAASSGSGSFPSWSLLNRSRTSLHVLVPQFKFKFSYLLVGAYSLLFNRSLKTVRIHKVQKLSSLSSPENKGPFLFKPGGPGGSGEELKQKSRKCKELNSWPVVRFRSARHVSPEFNIFFTDPENESDPPLSTVIGQPTPWGS